jgi:uncharacterized protein
MREPLHFYLYWALFNISLLGQTFFVVSTLVLLLRASIGWKLVGFFRYLGQMSLTNYLLQSVLGVFLFKIFGLYGKSTPGYDFILTLLFTAMQVRFSKFWIKKYGQGPAEALWRKTTLYLLSLVSDKRSIVEQRVFKL